MKVTKYEHATLVIEKAEERLIVDPGKFLSAIDQPSDVVAVVITHQHDDHWTPERLEAILEKNPDAKVYGPQGVADAASGFDVQVVKAGDVVEAGPFTLKFFGEKHAIIHPSLPVIDNVGVLIDDSLYYGGDSYTVPDVPVETLAAPIGAPWLKIGEAIDYVLAVKPKRAFPVHDMTLSVVGKDMAGAHLTRHLNTIDAEYIVLQPGESIDL
jgi:L-ascorbate metabolism protein UlaG (beta-lactamase superfamily)